MRACVHVDMQTHSVFHLKYSFTVHLSLILQGILLFSFLLLTKSNTKLFLKLFFFFNQRELLLYNPLTLKDVSVVMTHYTKYCLSHVVLLFF